MLVIWSSFVLFVLVLLALDLGVFHRKAHVVTMKEALSWSAVWISVGLMFSVVVYFGYEYHWMGLGSTVDAVDGTINDGRSATLKYLVGYIVEKSLSVDNIFVLAMIFTFMAVPTIYQHRVLFWGILGALIMRGIMIGVGAALIARFHWMLYIFAAFLIVTAIKMLALKTRQTDPSENRLTRLIQRLFPVTDQFHGEHFFVRAGSDASKEPCVPGGIVQHDSTVEMRALNGPGVLMVTPLFVSLSIVEFTDLIFAMDSIPAVFSITADPFLVFTSNVFAMLGLRSLYFALAGMMKKFQYLKYALALILLTVGLKMIFAKQLQEAIGDGFNFYLLGVVLVILLCGVVASMLAKYRSDSLTAIRSAGLDLNGARELPEKKRFRISEVIVRRLKSVKHLLAKGRLFLRQRKLGHIRSLLVATLGGCVLLAGVAMIVLPGPAIIVVPLGLAILATEFIWAKRLFKRARGLLSKRETLAIGPIVLSLAMVAARSCSSNFA
jgi:tellurite resistance protein TerC